MMIWKCREVAIKLKECNALAPNVVEFKDFFRRK